MIKQLSDKAQAKNDRIRLINDNTEIIGKFERQEDNKERCFICTRKIKNGYIIQINEKRDFLGATCIKKHKHYLCDFRKKVKKYKKHEKMKKKITGDLNKDYGKSFVIKYAIFLYKREITKSFYSFRFQIHKPNPEHLDYMIESTNRVYGNNDFKNIYKIDDNYYININCKIGMYDDMIGKDIYKIWIFRSDDERRFTFNHKYGVRKLPTITNIVSCYIDF